MKKRILGLALCLAMLVSIVPFGAFAAYQDNVSVSGSTQTIDGVSYTVVTTETALRNAMAAGKTAILGNDITLTSATQISFAPGALLDGNGYAVTYNSYLTDSLLVFQTGKITGAKGGVGTVTIRNLNFGTNGAPMKLSGTKSLAKETATENSPHQIHVIWQNVEFYVANSGATAANGGLFSTVYGTHEFAGCTMNVNILASKGSLIGGWIGTMSGAQIYMKDCVTKGSVEGVGAVGGFVGELSGQSARFENCTNMANVTATSSYCGGFVGNSGTGIHSVYFVNCKNYGLIRSKGTGYNAMAGGIIGRFSNTKTYDMGVNSFYNCINYGKIISGSSAGGFMGRSHDYDATNPQYFTFRGCLNVGEISGNDFAGGMAGSLAPTAYSVIMTDCANVGKITSSNGKAGNFAGMLSSATLTDCYAAGYITAPTTGVLAGQTTGSYTVVTGSAEGSVLSFVAPTLKNVRYLSNLADSRAQGATLVTDATLEDTLADMKNTYGVGFMLSDEASDLGTYVTIATPQLRGLQQSTVSQNGKTDLRFAATINALESYEKVGFRIEIRMGEQSIELDRTTTMVYTSLNASSVNGTISTVTASSMSAKYLYALTLTGVPTSKDVSIAITPYAVTDSGAEYVGKTTVIICSDGKYHTETMMLNGVPLEQFSIVYPAASSNNEKLLAERLANKIGRLTGHTVSCYSDSTPARDNEILIGKTNRYDVTVNGRWIYAPEANGSDVILTASGTTALSEVVQYFLDTIEEKRANGQCAWSIEGSIQVPTDEQLSIMAFNMGATDDADIKKAEWNLIVDYLPDVWTAQEPWAGFLDDFLNDYAVQPDDPFKEDPNDDDVMLGEVNNKAFTGKGYYGVYWGAPRWKPTDPKYTALGYSNHAGKASYSVILYAKDRFTVDESKSGTFWLSNRPNVSNSKLSESSFARCATYATLIDQNTNERIVVVNVHLDTKNNEVRRQQVAILLEQLAIKVGTSIPIFITGDMNASRASGALDQFYTDGWTSVDTMADLSYHYDSTIDWIFTNSTTNVTAQFYQYCNERTFYNQVWQSYPALSMPSDHPAIYAEVTVDTGATRPTPAPENPPATVHTFGDWLPDTSKADGHYRDCECGEMRETEACKWKFVEQTVAPTFTKEGKALYACTVCGRTEQRAVPVLIPVQIAPGNDKIGFFDPRDDMGDFVWFD